jgi:P27 family predicted phage terminase small subunit
LHGDKPSRINRAEPQPRDLAPTKPAGLTPGASAEWDRVLPDLLVMGVKAADTVGLTAFCEAVALFADISATIARDGPMVAGQDGTERRHPLFGALFATSRELRMWSREFGLTPSARSALRGTPAGGPGDRLLT